MYILGINQGHNSTACLLKDGKIVHCVSEERFSRLKNHYGIPKESISWILEKEKISLNEIEYFVFDDAYPFKEVGFSQPEEIKKRYSHKSFSDKLKTFLATKFPKTYPSLYDGVAKIRTPKKKFQENLVNKLSEKLKIPKEKILLMDHHALHAFSCCFNIPSDEKTLIFTLDGEGSDSSATVNIWGGKELKRISKTSKYDSLGYLYSLATLHLGMKPMQHEFKVMGLAPYAKEEGADKVYQKLREIFHLDKNLVMHCKYPAMFIDKFYEKEMKFVRFDNFAAGLQKLVEEITKNWIKDGIKKTGIKRIALSGGVFMNVKACQKISELPEVGEIFIMPSSGDESNAIGACFYGYQKYCKEKNQKIKQVPIKDLYLGPEYDNKYFENLIKKKGLDNKYKITKQKNINKKVAELLAKGKIVARCSGNSEWGARALGNRSILSNPSDKESIRILNELIKDRDFWMPFTPSILDKYEKDYIQNPKKIFSPYMVITYNSTEKAKEDLKAAMHPYDFTIRPQIVTKEYNKDYYEVIENFKKLTNIGGILNTSFNLHGEPNVLTPEDALHTLDNSGLKYLAVGNYLVEKK